MGAAVVVDPDGLRGTGPRFDAIADGVAAVLRRLGSALDAEGSCWGADEPGTTFGSSYAPAAERARAALALLQAAVTDVGASVRLAAANAEASDGRATTRLG